MAFIDFPNIPNVPGVPNIARSGITVDQDAVLSAVYSGNVLSIIDSVTTPKWGIYGVNGKQVIRPDSVIDFDYKGDAKVIDYPIEKGGFSSFNKVQSPYDIRIKMACGGNLATGGMTRESFLERLDEMKENLELYDIVTPDKVYGSVDLVHYDYRRSASNGVTLLIVDALFTEVRVLADAQYAKVKSESAAQPVLRGDVATSKPTNAKPAGSKEPIT